MSLRISDRRPAAVVPGPTADEPVDWPRPVAIGLLITVAVFALGSLLSVVTLPKLVVAVGCVVLAAAAILIALVKTRTGFGIGRGQVHAAVCGIAAAAWLGYAGTTTAWSPVAVAALLVPAAILIPLYPVIRSREDRAAEEARRAGEAAAAAKQLRRWPDLLARIGHQGVRYAGQEETMAGYLVHLRLPGSGRVTYSQLAPATEQLEVAARLRHGSLRFERGDQAHKVILHVAERDVLAETIPLPDDEEPLSITRPIPLGVYEDGQVCAVTLRELATLIVGLRGSGKSNLLNVLLAQLARCPDVLIFAIDLKGGRMAAPWIEPWLADRSPRPVVDWLATDRLEAEKMLNALLRAVDARSRSGSGGEKIMPSPRQPAILLLCDEVAILMGIGTGAPRVPGQEGSSNVTLARLATQLVMTGRSEAIDLIMATQRGAVTMTGSADLKSQCGLRIGLGVASEADARLIIPDDIRIAADLARLRHPGTGIVQQGKQGRVLPVKFFRIDHDRISKIAERYGLNRPDPDQLLADALGPDYARRWSPERMPRVPGVPVGPAAPAAIAAGPDPASPLTADQYASHQRATHPFSGDQVPAGPPLSGGQPAAGQVSAGPPEPFGASQYAVGAAGQASPAEFGGPPAGFLSIGPPGAAPGAAQDAAHPGRGRMLVMLRSAGVKGITARGISEQLTADGLTVSPQTVHRWLAEEAAAGRAENASYGRWKWRPARL